MDLKVKRKDPLRRVFLCDLSHRVHARCRALDIELCASGQRLEDCLAEIERAVVATVSRGSVRGKAGLVQAVMEAQV